VQSEHAISALARYLRTQGPAATIIPKLGIVDWIQANYYIPETSAPMRLEPHQISLLQYIFGPHSTIPFEPVNIIYSSIKKSGKTAIAGAVARWIAETWGPYQEVFCIANDMEQARGRVYAAAQESIELMPGYDRIRRVLPGKWKVIERQLFHTPSSSVIKAISSDYKGEAGSNPTCTLWSELWGYSSEASRRLYDELTPVPTRKRSIRYIETYAGFEGESDLLIHQYKLGMSGHRLTHDDIDWPFPDQPPIYINERARLVMYWDEGIVARRMPWQTQAYYDEEAVTLRPEAFERLHMNHWTSSVSEFLPIEWWTRRYNPTLLPLTPDTPLVLGVDAAVSSDCAAIVGVTRSPTHPENVAIRFCYVWTPTEGHPIDFTILDNTLRDLCKTYNVVEVAYDAYQLHKLMTDLVRDGIAWCRSFSQNDARLKADKQLYDVIRDGMLEHTNPQYIEDHLKGAAAKTAKDEDTRLRIVKKSSSSKIDAVVAMSMAVAECLRLNLD
jgi:phage terminase large subunit-like protein